MKLIFNPSKKLQSSFPSANAISLGTTSDFEDPIIRYLNSLDRIIVAVSSENKLLELEISVTEDDSPSKNRTQLILLSNIYILDLLEAFMYIFENLYASSDNADSADELLDYFSKLETSFADTINNSEITFSGLRKACSV